MRSKLKRLFVTLPMMLVALMASGQSCPDNNHPHAIDLGLPSGTKWACCNVGTTTPESYGSYYAWGEKEEKEKYDWTTYIHCDGSMKTCQSLGSDIAGTEYDVAHVKWGGFGVMPSKDQFQELIDKCSYTGTIENGVIISFTSFPARINDVWKVVESLKNQSILPAKIILWLSKEQFPDGSGIPASLKDREGDIFEIRIV